MTFIPAGTPSTATIAALLLRDGRLRGVLLMGDCTAAAALTARLEAMSLPPWTGFLTLLQRSRRLQE